MGNIEDWNSSGVVDADDALGVLHADLILNRAGNCDVDDVIGLDGRAGLTDLFLVRQPAVVNDRTGRVRQLYHRQLHRLREALQARQAS